MTSHANCAHPATKKDRSACRKAQGAGKVHTASGRLSDAKPRAQKVPAGPKSFAEANELGNIDHETLDDRIRDAKRRPTASPVKVSRIDS